MGRQGGDQNLLFYPFNLERRILACHLLRRANSVVTGIGRPAREAGSLLSRHWPALDRSHAHDPMLIVGHFYGIHFERRLCEEVELHLAHRWFCRLDLDDKLPKVISPTNPCSAWTEKANKRVQFGCGLNYMIDVGHARSMVERPKRRSV